MENTKKTSILIEVVSNGFLVHEDYYSGRVGEIASVSSRKVFNTKKQLYNYIGEHL